MTNTVVRVYPEQLSDPRFPKGANTLLMGDVLAPNYRLSVDAYSALTNLMSYIGECNVGCTLVIDVGRYQPKHRREAARRAVHGLTHVTCGIVAVSIACDVDLKELIVTGQVEAQAYRSKVVYH